MKVLIVGKYPPVQGGVSGQTYWLAHRLADQGHTVVVVTDACRVSDDYRMWLTEGDLAQLVAVRPAARGGSVRVLWTEDWDEWAWHHVPPGDPATARLTSLTMDAVAANQPDVIIAYYLEPYAQAAATASAATGVPWAVRHAGSDRYHLMDHPELSTYYTHLLRSCDLVITAGDDLAGFGVASNRTVSGAFVRYIPPSFVPTGDVLDVNRAIVELGRSDNPFVGNRKPIDYLRPTVGMFGKLGSTKGSFDLLRAVAGDATLRDSVQLLYMCGGLLRDRFERLVDSLDLNDQVWTIPFMPHWRVPEFLRACDVVCVLERRFSIPQHGSSQFEEVAACGRSLVVSSEIFRKLAVHDRPAPGVFVVDDPRDSNELAVAVTAAVRFAQKRTGRPTVETHCASTAAAENDLAEFTRHLAGLRRRTPAPSIDAGMPFLNLLQKWAPTLHERFHVEAAAAIASAGPHVNGIDDHGAAVMACVDRLVAARPDDEDHQLLGLEADFFWLACHSSSEFGLNRFSIPDDALPEQFVRDRRWISADTRISRHLVRSNAIRVRMWTEWHIQTVAAMKVGEQSHAGPGTAVRGRPRFPVLLVKRPSLEGSIVRVGAEVVRLIELADGDASEDSILETVRAETLHSAQSIGGVVSNLLRMQVMKRFWRLRRAA